MHTHFFLINRSQYAMQNHFFQCKRFASAMHIVSFHIGNIPYAPGTAIPFGLGLKNPMDLRFISGRGLENPSNFWFVFIRGIKNRIGIGFIRPLPWSFVGRMQYAPTLPDENSSGFWFVFIRGIKNRIGIKFIRPLEWPFVGRIQYAPTRVPEKMAIFLSVRSLPWSFVGRMQYAPTRAT